MSSRAVKVAVSMPSELFRAVETARKRTRQSRSAAVQEAVRLWLKQRAQGELVREYEAGYRKRPEGKREIEAAMRAAVDLLENEEDW